MLTMNTERRLLEILQRVHPRLMAVNVAWSELLMDEQRASYAGFKAALLALEEKGQVVKITGEDRDRVKITDAGLARLAE